MTENPGDAELDARMSAADEAALAAIKGAVDLESGFTQAQNAAMRALYRQLDEQDLPGDPPFDVEAGLRDLRERMAEDLSSVPPWYVSDPPGQDLRPDPDAVTTVPELLEAMCEYHQWAGNASFQTLAGRCRYRVSMSTFSAVLAGDKAPTLPVLQNLIAACGSTPEYYARFEAAWRRVK